MFASWPCSPTRSLSSIGSPFIALCIARDPATITAHLSPAMFHALLADVIVMRVRAERLAHRYEWHVRGAGKHERRMNLVGRAPPRRTASRASRSPRAATSRTRGPRGCAGCRAGTPSRQRRTPSRARRDRDPIRRPARARAARRPLVRCTSSMTIVKGGYTGGLITTPSPGFVTRRRISATRDHHLGRRAHARRARPSIRSATSRKRRTPPGAPSDARSRSRRSRSRDAAAA